jgi:hypothetical protein
MKLFTSWQIFFFPNVELFCQLRHQLSVKVQWARKDALPCTPQMEDALLQQSKAVNQGDSRTSRNGNPTLE